MLRRLLQLSLSLTQKGKPLERLYPLISGIDHFFYAPQENTKGGPHIRDMIDLKRWMIIVVISLLPCTLMAIWNAGVHKWVYGSFDPSLMARYLEASESFSSYFAFISTNGHYWIILKKGLLAFLPVLLISYLVGGFWEILFAVIRRHKISEGLLVTGILFALILPSTIPYWMVAVGVSAGIVIGKEIFGGTGMNILNPALVCRAFLFFAFPTKMTGPVWIGTNPTLIQESLASMNREEGTLGTPDSYSQASPNNFLNIDPEIKRIHVDAISLEFQKKVATQNAIEKRFALWRGKKGLDVSLGSLSKKERKKFITDPPSLGGLGLSPDQYTNALKFARLKEGRGILTNGNFFWGNRIGSFGETSIAAALLGALLLLFTRIGSWRTMAAVALGACLASSLFYFFATFIGPEGGAFNPAKYTLPVYKQFLIGSLTFGLIFMATEPVSSPGRKGAKWVYGFLIGIVVILIRLLNPAFVEGVMLAILLGNVFAPLLDHFFLRSLRKKRYDRRKKILFY